MIIKKKVILTSLHAQLNKRVSKNRMKLSTLATIPFFSKSFGNEIYRFSASLLQEIIRIWNTNLLVK